MSILTDYLKGDRQWTRALRIAHAKQQLVSSTEEADKQFWQQMLEANGGDHERQITR